MIKVAVNGYGRIGRNIVRAIYESGYHEQIKVVGINDLADPEINFHLTKYDSVHGRFNAEISLKDNLLSINGDEIPLYSKADPEQLPWGELGVDVVFECTGRFKSREDASKHLTAGARKVLISAPGTDVDATVVYGVNDDILEADHQIVSNASCTTNCLAPVAKVLNDNIGIESGLMTTIHAFTNDQHLIDMAHKDLYRARSATLSMIPTKTGAAKAVGIVLPELEGKFDGMAVRVPTVNVSLVDLTMTMARDTTVEEINALIKAAAEGPLKGVLAYNEEALVSIDYNHSAVSSTFDAAQTRVNGPLVKIMAWYDNEWGFSNRMLDTAVAMIAVESEALQKAG